MFINRIVLIFFTLITFAKAAAVNPSFDCNKAKSKAENIICNNTELASQDKELSILYQQAKAINYNDAFKAQNKYEWKRRESECMDYECIKNWYINRKAQLTKYIEIYSIESKKAGGLGVEVVNKNTKNHKVEYETLEKIESNKSVTLNGKYHEDTYIDCCLMGKERKLKYSSIKLHRLVDSAGSEKIKMNDEYIQLDDSGLSSLRNVIKEGDGINVVCETIFHGETGHFALPLYCNNPKVTILPDIQYEKQMVTRTRPDIDDMKSTVGMTKKQVKQKFGLPDSANAEDGTFYYLDIYNQDTEKKSTLCSLKIRADEVVDVRCYWYYI